MTNLIDAYIKARMGYDAWDRRYGGWNRYRVLPTWMVLEQYPGYPRSITIETARQAEAFIDRIEK